MRSRIAIRAPSCPRDHGAPSGPLGPSKESTAFGAGSADGGADWRRHRTHRDARRWISA